MPVKMHRANHMPALKGLLFFGCSQASCQENPTLRKRIVRNLKTVIRREGTKSKLVTTLASRLVAEEGIGPCLEKDSS
jgi:hypothetical protein